MFVASSTDDRSFTPPTFNKMEIFKNWKHFKLSEQISVDPADHGFKIPSESSDRRPRWSSEKKSKIIERLQRCFLRFFSKYFRLSMGFSYQLNALTDEELAKAAKEEFGETKNLMEVHIFFYRLLFVDSVTLCKTL